MQFIALIIAVSVLMCRAAVAQIPLTFAQSGAQSGVITGENLSLNGTGQGFVYGKTDLSLHYRFGEGLQIGADLGVDSLQANGQHGGTVFATAGVESAFGKLSVGVPRLVMPQFFDVPAFGGSEVLGVIQGLASGEVLGFMTYFSQTPTLRGLRYDGQAGKITFAASLQQLGDSNRWVHAVALRYVQGAYTVSVGRTDVDVGPYTAITTKAGVFWEKHRFSGGVVASTLAMMGRWENTLNGFIGYALREQVTVEGQVFDIFTATDTFMTWGADVRLGQPSGLFVKAGIARLTPQGDSIVTLSLGYQF